MIHRTTSSAEKLDVAGLNEITVLIDRSETELTEVALNSWSPGLDGPPHAHDRKEQNFLVTAGRGEVVIGSERFPAAPGDFFYVPAGVVHQTINLKTDARLDYFLFNAFLGADKEGHASFADHIGKVKETRRQQAASQQSGAAAKGSGAPSCRGKRIETTELAGPSTTLLDRGETERCEAVHHNLTSGQRLEIPADADKEQTVFMVSGSGRFTIGAESVEIAKGETVFVPRETTASIEAGENGLEVVFFGTVVTEKS